MQLRIKKVAALAPGLDNPQQWQQWAMQSSTPGFDESAVTVPKLEFMPMMQRRRLSKFARLCCYTLHQLIPTDQPQTQQVFTSRFGDLTKTTELIENIVDQQMLSPAQFGLSVHNAVAGQYSLFTNNKQPSTTITAGPDSFHMGLIEAIARLTQSTDNELVLVCTETVTPVLYADYVNHQDIDHSVAILLSKTEGQSLTVEHSAKPDTTADIQLAQTDDKPLPQALEFLAWFYANASACTTISSSKHQWVWKKET